MACHATMITQMPTLFCTDDLASSTEDNLPGQPFSNQTAQSLPWDPGSLSAPQPPPTVGEESNPGRRRAATFQAELPARARRRPARLPSVDTEEEEAYPAGNQFRRAVPSAPALRGSSLPEASALRRPQPVQRPADAPGQGSIRRNGPASSQTAAGGATSMANQLKVAVAATGQPVHTGSHPCAI